MNVLVTGASKGIGRSVVLELLNHDCINKVYVTSTNRQKLKFKNSRIIEVELDYLQSDCFYKLNEVLNEVPLHLLINNSGYLFNGSLLDTSAAEIENTLAVNYIGPFNLVKVLFENLKNGQGHILNIGSMGGFQGSSKFPGLSIYSSSKAALANLSECWAEEFKGLGIRSNCLALGAVDTEMLNEAFPGYKSGVSSEQMAKAIVQFGIYSDGLVNGQVLPIAQSSPSS